jgi:hypothetical protein
VTYTAPVVRVACLAAAVPSRAPGAAPPTTTTVSPMPALGPADTKRWGEARTSVAFEE